MFRVHRAQLTDVVVVVVDGVGSFMLVSVKSLQKRKRSKETTRRFVSVVSATKASIGSRTQKTVRKSVVAVEKKTWKNVVVAESRRHVGEYW